MSERDFYPFNSDHLVLADGTEAVTRNSMGHLCGYTCFSKDEIPAHWAGDYDADAIQYLAIHGGPTYCEVAGCNQDERTATYRSAVDSVARPANDATLEDWVASMRERRAAGKRAMLSVPYTHVVFGFDCGHLDDELNARLGDVSHVMRLAREMREQLVAYAARLQEWKSADRDTRIKIIEEIRSKYESKELGFGALIGALSGAKEFDPA